MLSELNHITHYSFSAEKTPPYFHFAIHDIRDGLPDKTLPDAHVELYLIERGGGSHIIDEVTYPMQDRSVHILQPGVPHRLQRDHHTRGSVVAFTLDALADDPNIITRSLVSFFRSTLAQPVAVLSTRAFMELKALAEVMKSDAQNSRNLERLSYVRSLFSNFLLTLKPNFSISHKGDNGDMMCMVNKFQELVEMYYNEGLPIADYAAKIGTTEKTLTRAVKKHSAHTPARMIRERVMLEAARLLQHTTYSIKEIAYHLHFSDPAHFIKVFRQEKNCTPLEYRRMTIR